MSEHRVAHGLGCGEPQRALMLKPVGLDAECDHLGADSHRSRGYAVGRAMGAIDDDRNPSRRRPRGRLAFTAST